MKQLFFVLFLMMAVSCRILPPTAPIVPIDPVLIEKCSSLFPLKSFRAVHALTASMFGDKKSLFVGITVADIPSARIRSFLLSVEGMVLFDATSVNRTITIHRAVAPMDKQGFAQGLFYDVEFIYFPPQGTLTGAEVAADGTLVCRWQNNHRFVEISSEASGHSTLTERSESREVLRRAEFFPPLVNGFYKKILLEVYDVGGVGDLGGYSLSMDFLEGEPIAPSDDLFAP